MENCYFRTGQILKLYKRLFDRTTAKFYFKRERTSTGGVKATLYFSPQTGELKYIQRTAIAIADEEHLDHLERFLSGMKVLYNIKQGKGNFSIF